MYIDGFTVAALVVFIIMLAVFISFCRLKVCGMTATRLPDEQDKAGRGQS